VLGFVLVEEALALSWLGKYDRAVPQFEEALQLARTAASPHLEGRVHYCQGWQLLRQRDLPGATGRLWQALTLARTARQSDLEADTVLHLGMGAVHAGDYVRARSFLDGALALYRAQQHRLGETLVSYSLGLMAHARGSFGEARQFLEDSLELTRELKWHLVENWALHGLGLVCDEGWGRHTEAEGFFVQELRITEETGDRTRKAFALAALGCNALYQADLEQAALLLNQAHHLSHEVSSQESAAMALRGQGLLAHFLGDNRGACRCAEEALEIARTTGLRRDERLALRLLGHALLGLADLLGAVEAYRQAADLAELLGLQHLRAETATDLARAALAQGHTAQAAADVTAVLPDLEHGALAGLEEPLLAYLTCFQVLDACGDARMTAVLAAGYTFLQKRAEQFVDEERRSRYLNNLPAHRDLMAAWHARDARTLPHLHIVHAESG
jgi:tetratricopeptide (TPR) repeat protein